MKVKSGWLLEQEHVEWLSEKVMVIKTPIKFGDPMLLRLYRNISFGLDIKYNGISLADLLTKYDLDIKNTKHTKQFEIKTIIIKGYYEKNGRINTPKKINIGINYSQHKRIELYHLNLLLEKNYREL